MANEAVLETVTMSYGEDGILRIKIADGAVIGLTQAKLQFETIRRLCGDVKVAVLVDATASHSVTKEAQEFAAQNAGNRIATAVINGNALSIITLNLFQRIFKPASQFKVFSNETSALIWLREKIASGN